MRKKCQHLKTYKTKFWTFLDFKLFICKTLKTLLLPAVTSTAGRVDNTAGVGSGEVLSDVTDCVWR